MRGQSPHFELARRLEFAEGNACARFVEARKATFPQCDSCWTEIAGVMAMHDGASSPSTQTFGLGLRQPVTVEDLSAIEKFFADRGSPVQHEVSPLAGIAVLTLLSERGYVPIELSSVMVRSIPMEFSPALPRNPRIQVRLIERSEMPLWSKTTAEGWRDVADLSSLFSDIGKICSNKTGLFAFLAELDGQPIAAASMNIHAGVALLAGACTIPAARNQGAQLALLECRLAYAAAQGCDLAMIGAEPGGGSERNAERNGFRVAYTRTKWQLRKQGT